MSAHELTGSGLERATVDGVTDSDDSAVIRAVVDVDIRNLLARLAQLADGGEVDDYLSLFTEDAVWQMNENLRAGVAASRSEGLDEIAAGVRARRNAATPGVTGMHFVATTAIDVDGDVATADSYFQFVSGAADLTMRSAGKYHDTLRRTEAGWKIASRVITFG